MSHSGKSAEPPAPSSATTTDMIEDAIREITKELQKADERIVYVYVRPSD
jgi:hypothetical protein